MPMLELWWDVVWMAWESGFVTDNFLMRFLRDGVTLIRP